MDPATIGHGHELLGENSPTSVIWRKELPEFSQRAGGKQLIPLEFSWKMWKKY